MMVKVPKFSLRHLMGDIYAEVVLACLDGLMFQAADGGTDEVVTSTSLFKDLVVQKLTSCIL